MFNWFRKWLLKEVNDNLVFLWGRIVFLEKRIEKMGTANDLLVSEVAGLTTVVESAIALINGFLAQIKNAATLAEVQAVVAEIETEKQKLADAVAANTPEA